MLTRFFYMTKPKLKATMGVRAGLLLLPFQRVNASSGNGGDVITLIILIVAIVEDQ